MHLRKKVCKYNIWNSVFQVSLSAQRKEIRQIKLFHINVGIHLYMYESWIHNYMYESWNSLSVEVIHC